jgi:hypothetical protein
MSDQQQNAELATDRHNDLTLFLVHRLLICSSIDESKVGLKKEAVKKKTLSLRNRRKRKRR